MQLLLIRDGLLLDGNPGAVPQVCDVLISGDRIIRIGKKLPASGARTLEARGLVVAPGFIDSHSHSDTAALMDSSAQGRVFEGVATEINGTCGLSSFPLEGPDAERRRKLLHKIGIRAYWRNAKGYFARIEEHGSAINRAFLVGHGALRAAVMGYAARPSSSRELRRMERLLDEALEQGAIGMSSGLCYAPGCFARTEELVALCKLLARAGRPYCTHLRNEGRLLLTALREAMEVSRRSGAALHVSHVKTRGPANWWKIERLERALFNGQDVSADRYPYLAAMTDLAAIFPEWLLAGGIERALKRLESRSCRARLEKAVESSPTKKAHWDRIRIAVATPETRKFEGLTLIEVAERLGTTPCKAAFEILRRARMSVSAIFFEMSDENLERILKWPFVFIGSDSSARSLSGPTAQGKPHPRTFGTFARFLGEYVRERKLMPLAQAIARVTSLPAARFGLKDRGILREGAFADVVVFDPERIRDTATYERPLSLSEGVLHLLVNGEPVLLYGRQTDARPGRVLRAT